MTKVKDILQHSLQKSNAAAAAAKDKEAAIASAAATPAESNSDTPAASNSQVAARSATISLDSKKLLQNLQLQQGLLKENKDLMKTFQETVMQGGLPYEEFWSTRVHILRAHALTSSQKRGPYNVLSTIKPTTNSDNKVSVSVSREKIHDIFEQYPLVRHAYNECVPKISEGEFWSRFFLSRLFRRLRGEKQKPTDPTDMLLDKYLDQIDNSSLTGVKRKANEMADEEEFNVPFFLNIAGNEESDPQKLGNRPDMTMRSGTEGQNALSLIRSMNNLSQKMIYGSTDSGFTISKHDKDESNLVNELKLGGLEEESAPDYMELHLKAVDSAAITGDDSTASKNPVPSADGSTPASTPAQTPSHAQIMQYLRSNLEPNLDLQQAGLEYPDGIKKAQKQITKTIRLRAKEASDNRSREEREIEKDVFEHVHLCHATSVEFLRHFWIHFQSGDPAQAPAITKLVASLKKSIQRIDAVKKSAPENGELVEHALQPLVASIHKALLAYNIALSELANANSNNVNGAAATATPTPTPTPTTLSANPSNGNLNGNLATPISS